jgi:hypothetical protein
MRITKTKSFVIKFLFYNLIFLIFSNIADAQATDKDSIKDLVKNKLEISVEGMSKAIYAGRNYGVDQFGLNPSIAFEHRSGLKLSVFAYGMGKTTGLIAETDFGISYTKKLTSKFSLTPGYSYILNRSDSANLLNNVLSLAEGLEFDFISINNYTAFSFGKATGWYDEVSLSKYINLSGEAKHKLFLSPTIVMVMGTKEALATFGHGATSYKTSINRIVGNGKSNGKGNGSSSTSGSMITATTTTEISKKFMALSYDFILPITYAYKIFAFSVIPHYDIPVNLGESESTLTGNPFYVTGKIVLSIPVSK